MTKNKSTFLNRNIFFIPTMTGIIVFFIGVFVIIGWAFDITLFKSIHPNLVTVKPNTAVALCLSGISLILLSQYRKQPFVNFLVKLIPLIDLVIVGIGFITILEYLINRNLGIDQLLFREPLGAIETFVPGRMSPLAAGAFFLIGISHLAAYFQRHWARQFISLIIIMSGVAALFGYGFQVEALYGPGPYTSISLYSAVSFLIIGIGTISLYPEKSVIRVMIKDDIGGLVARRLLPTAIVIPLFLGFIILSGQRMGFYQTNVTVLLITISTVIIFTIIIFSNARLLSLIENERRESERIGLIEVESAQERLRYLAQASRILARSLDYEVTLDRVARLSVPFIADWCAIDMVDNGDLKRVTIKHVDETKHKIVEELAEKYPTNPDSDQGVHSVIASGTSLLIFEIPEPMMLAAARDNEHLRLLRALDLHSIMIVPLKGRETIFGAITFATAESKRVFTQDDLELTEDLGRRAALAIENAKLFQETKSQKENLEVRVLERTNELEVANLELKTEIIERKRIETELRESEETLAALVRTASRLITLRSLDEVSEIICQETAAILDVPICTTKLFESRKNRWRYVYGHGLPASFGQQFNLTTESSKQNIESETGKHYIVTPDVQTLTDSPNFELYKSHNIRTTVDMDMVFENKLIGRLMIATINETRDFSENQLLLLKGLADQAALAIQNAQLLEQLQTSRERLRRLTRELVTSQEGERRRISRELHDEAGQSLTAMKINLSLLTNIIPNHLEDLKEQIVDLSDLADDIMERLRRLAHDLRPPALETLGLNKSLEGLCRQFSNRTNLSINYQGIEKLNLPEELTITIYRLVQESLTNIAKHAQADKVDVKFEEWNSLIIVSIKDNGQGFNVEEIINNKYTDTGLGLKSMRERIEFVDGLIEIHSTPGQGTEIIASIPLEMSIPN